MIVEPFFFPCCACCGSQHLALFWSFLGRSGLHRSRSSQNGRDRSRLVNTNEIATFSLTRELANISGTKLKIQTKQCWDELRIHMKILTKTSKIESWKAYFSCLGSRGPSCSRFWCSGGPQMSPTGGRRNWRHCDWATFWVEPTPWRAYKS